MLGFGHAAAGHAARHRVERFLAAVMGEADGLAACLGDCWFGHEVFLKHADEVAAPAG